MSLRASALRIIQRVKLPLAVLELLFLAAFAAELYYLRDHRAFEPGRMEMLALLMPPLGACVCFFPLCYHAWFSRPSSSWSDWWRTLFFWFVVLLTALIWFNLITMSLALPLTPE
ncbi:hypothetical protein [Pseudoxanthomonas japonensis]|uniref:hypothetical protein n=1 Tax=Pseudoxanthomonas japonensis TaxID=69284 RepID=UPI0037479ACD